MTGNKVIIKELPAGYSKRHNDFSILRGLRHPGLPAVCDAFENSGRMYIIIEYIDGGNLREYIKTRGMFNESEAFSIAIDILDVLDYLHSVKPKGIIHGDIKPENIIIKDSKAVLIDFGSVDEDDASSGFCAPERFAGLPKSIESDIYSTGEILYYMINGNVKKVYNRKKAPDISNDTYKIIDKSTKKLPADRYHKAAEMAAEIRRLKQMREAGIDDNAAMRTICVPGCPEAACEMAVSLGGLKGNVLIADLDMLAPSAHTILGIDKFGYCLQDFLAGDSGELRNECVEIKKSGLYLLPCRIDYENYESAAGDCMTRLIAGASGFFDVLIVSCSGFPYDRYFMDSLIYSDIMVLPVVRGVVDIRKYNSMARFLCDKQNVPEEKIFYMGVDICNENISGLIAAGAVETTWIGNIPHSLNRANLYSSGKPYIKSLKKRVFSRYIRLLNKTGVLN